MKLKDSHFLKENYKPRQCIKKQRHYFANKVLSSQRCGFSSSHVWMWKLDHKKGWAPKNWFFWTVVLEKTLEKPLACKEIKQVSPKGNQPWLFIGRTHVEAKNTILWLPDRKSQLIRKDPDTVKTEGSRRRGWQRMRWLDCNTDSVDLSLSKLRQMVKEREDWHVLQYMGWQKVRHKWATEHQQHCNSMFNILRNS